MKKLTRKTALVLALTLLLGGCAKEGAAESTSPSEPAVSASAAPVESAPVETAPALSPEEEAAQTAVVEGAEATLNSLRWPEEREVKTLEGEEVEFVRFHGEGWTIQVPADWERPFPWDWRALSENAGFSVNKWDYPVNNPKIYHAKQGSWSHETGYAPPFDYYYDDDGGYTPPEGSADYAYFFAPAGEQSYEFTLSGVVGQTTALEKAILEAMLLSFTQDENSHILYGDYQRGRSEWDFAMAGLLAESETLWGSWTEGNWAMSQYCKGLPDYLHYAQALTEFEPGEFVQFDYGEWPEGLDRDSEFLILGLPEEKLWLYLYQDSPWVGVYMGEETWWTKAQRPGHPEECPYDAAMAWIRAEQDWEAENGPSEAGVFARAMGNYSFLSGAGGWSTELLLDGDGSFWGDFHDSDMGDMGEGYPDGTVYHCSFRGKFAKPQKIDRYTYVTKPERLDYALPGEESIEDDTRFVSAGPYGLENAGEIEIYLPGYPIANIPEEERIWLLSAPGLEEYTLDELGGQTLPCYVLRNVDEGLLFFSSEGLE